MKLLYRVFIANKGHICDKCKIIILKDDKHIKGIKEGKNYNTVEKILCLKCYKEVIKNE